MSPHSRVRPLLFLAAAALAACGRPATDRPAAPPPGSLEIVFTYGSEKEKWIHEVTEAFNVARRKTSDGRVIHVTALPMGSGESIDEILSGQRQAHLTSPASGAFITLGNAKSRVQTGKDLVPQTENLVLSPVVIAMWKPMAETLGWGKKPVGWAEILALTRDPRGWGAHGKPQWGRFKFGHTHPEHSNSGLISLLAEVYAGAGKTAGLTLADVKKPKVAATLRAIESGVVHYGSSTGFFGRKMFDNGPSYLSAAVLYENMVIESYSRTNLTFPVVAIYPKEGTFWSDHPVGLVDRPWVTPAHQEAGRLYIRYLMERPQQEKAIAYGFRPGNPEVSLSAPIDAAHGVDPLEPKTTLEVPPADVMEAVIQLWRANKKSASLVLVLDTSGSMEGERIVNARNGAKQLVQLLGEADTFSLLSFSDTQHWVLRDVAMAQGRAQAVSAVEGLMTGGGTALYDSVRAAHEALSKGAAQSASIQAVVVLTDGEDNRSRTALDDLVAAVRLDSESRPVRVFAIGYGAEANEKALSAIADSAQGKFFKGKPENIESVFKEISTFF